MLIFQRKTRTKLDDRRVKTIFVYYKRGGYKLYNPMTKKVIVSRDVSLQKMRSGNRMEKYMMIRVDTLFLTLK